MSRIVLYGGSFDPIHWGHLNCARDAKRLLFAHEVWFIPAASSPMKDNSEVSFDERAEMIRRMIKPFKRFKCCLIEAHLPQPSYTFHTVIELKKRYPQHEFIWLIGSDQANQFSSWYKADKLSKLIQFAVYPRQAEDKIPSFMKRLPIVRYYPQSSTAVRQGAVDQTSPAVVQYMMKRQLYLPELARSMHTEKRFKHVLSVLKLALELGEKHRFDLNEVYLAALFHDCAKNWPKQKLKRWLKFVDPKRLDEDPELWHAYVGAAYVRRVLHIHSDEIYQAIYHHTLGGAGRLTRLLYIADKCERTRPYDSEPFIQTAYQDLDKAYHLVYQNTQNYLKEK